MRRTSSYPSDLTDGQWQVIAPHLPADQPGRRGRPRIWPLRVIVEAILYLDRTGCPWRYLPDSFPPWPTVYGYFAAWRDDGTLAAVHDALRARVRAAAGRDTEPTAAIIDSQSVRAADTVPRASRGWDNAKKVNGRKRHIAVDAMGLLLAVVITAASVQDRDAARPLLWNLHRASRHIRLIWADAVYTGKLSSWAASMKMTLCIVARRQPHTFEVLPRRWVVERTFAWISKHRRTVRDYETLPASHEAMILWAMIALMTRRLTQPAELSDAHLEQRGISDLGEADGGSVLAFLESLLDRWAKSSLFWVVSNFRPFLKFTGRANLVAAVNLAGVRRSRPIIEVLGHADQELVVRACAAGHVSARNAAITLLAVTTGLRACDIIGLRLADVDWRGATIAVVQQKTGNPLTLPLPPLVMGKLCDYVLGERPATADEHVFVRSVAPHVHLADHASVHQVISATFAAAGVADGKAGTRFLRHSAATRLLRAAVPLPTISAVLGHSAEDSTSVYMNADRDRLLQCVLPVPAGARR